MNACEKMIIAKMNLRGRRGWSVQVQTDHILREMRMERHHVEQPYLVVVWHPAIGTMGEEWCATLKEARFVQLRCKNVSFRNDKNCVVSVYDRKTKIQIF